jgi:hypothetical protein
LAGRNQFDSSRAVPARTQPLRKQFPRYLPLIDAGAAIRELPPRPSLAASRLPILGALAMAAVMLAMPASAAPRTKTRFDGIRDCERLGAAEFRRHDPAFKRFLIDRSKVVVDKYADKIGRIFVATIYHGKAIYESRKGPRTTRFICLHGGAGRDAVFVYTLGD